MKIGDVIEGKYKILRLLGEGGMGSVYEGENTRIHRRVAIKILHASVASNEDVVQRFEREAQAAGRIGSEHIVEVLDLGHLENSDRYMVMEFLEGEALADRISSRGSLSPQATASIAIEILEGLKAAHSAQIIHRDMKPDNIFLLKNKGGKKDFVKIVDFGISKFNTLGGEFSMTRTGAVMGTPYYMSPEQAKGNRTVDHRADLYAVGVLLYECVAGSVPFQAETFNELLFKIVLEDAPRLSDAVENLDKDFAAITVKAMHRDPNARFQNAEQFQEALTSWLKGQPLPNDMTISAGTPATLAQTALPDARAGMAGTFAASSGGLTPAEIGSKTQAAWAQTGAPARTKSRLPLYASALAALALLGAGGFFLLTQSQSNIAQTGRPILVDAATEQRAQEAAKRETDLARFAAERAKAEAARAEAEQAKAEAEHAQLNAKLAAEERARAEQVKAEREENVQTARRRAVQRARTASKKPVKKAPPASPKKPKSSGRTIRTEL